MAAGPVDEIAERLARLCPQAGADLQDRAQRYGVADALAHLGTVLRAGAAPAAEVLADLDRLDEAFAEHGIDGLTTGGRAYERWPGSGGHPVVALWACPAARPCARLEPGDDRPQCALLDQPLTTRRIPL